MSKKQRGASAKERSDQAKSARERVKQQQNKKGLSINVWLTIGGAIAIALIAVTISIATNAGGVDQELLTKYESTVAERNILGAVDAPITIQVWEDFL